jgi:hypothetical protein
MMLHPPCNGGASAVQLGGHNSDAHEGVAKDKLIVLWDHLDKHLHSSCTLQSSMTGTGGRIVCAIKRAGKRIDGRRESTSKGVKHSIYDGGWYRDLARGQV